MRALRPARGVKEVIYPGYREHFTEMDRREQGIPLAATVVDEARLIGERHGIAFPA